MCKTIIGPLVNITKSNILCTLWEGHGFGGVQFWKTVLYNYIY